FPSTFINNTIMSQEFSEDLCWRVVYLHTEGLSTLEISNTLYMSKGI
ncbi:20657_t:CDS:2, partial [Funneliformis geosporum]